MQLYFAILAQNVLVVAELADRFQIGWLAECCGRKMMKWSDIPLIDRLLFADLHGMDELKVLNLKPQNSETAKKIPTKNRRNKALLSLQNYRFLLNFWNPNPAYKVRIKKHVLLTFLLTIFEKKTQLNFLG